MKTAICFLTCDRLPLSLRTLSSLAEFNDLRRYILLHGDDNSKDQGAEIAARDLGFKTVERTKRRAGVADMTHRLFSHAQNAGADFVLNLQNDWLSVATIPICKITEYLSKPENYCFRLCGAEKSPGRKFGTGHGGRVPYREVSWTQVEPGYESADIHWGHPPAVTRIEEAMWLTAGAGAESVSRARSGKITKNTLRVVENVFIHIGEERTPRFVA